MVTPLELACDESGYEGERLIGTTTDVFAHASVLMDAVAAAECMQELRNRIQSPATEYKANHILREKHRSVLGWFLDPAGPVLGHAHVFLIDKQFYVLRGLIGLLVPDGQAEEWAAVLYRDGEAAAGTGAWQRFLDASNDLMRVKPSTADDFISAVPHANGQAGEIFRRLAGSRRDAEALRDRLSADPATSIIDPLIPAIARAVAFWGNDSTPVTIDHDRQNMLTRQRVAQIKESGRIADLRLVNSTAEPRVQVADVIAGVARKLATDELRGHGDPRLTGLLRPFLDHACVWGDAASWSRLRPPRADNERGRRGRVNPAALT